jgi:ABC-type sugar transport system ATPase subunit
MDLPILLFDEPTRGVDAQTKRAIHRLLNALVVAGKAVIVVTSETQELLTLSDRIIIMSNGRLSAEMAAKEANQEKILQASFRYYSTGSGAGERLDAEL